MYRKKYIIVSIILVLLIIIAGVTLTIVRYNKTIEMLNEEITSLNEQLDQYEAEMTTTYQVNTNVKAGNAIEEFQIQEVNVKNDAVPENAITSLDELENKMYKINLCANTCLTKDMIEEEILTDDMRELDVVLSEIPIGLEIGDYVDVRISFSLGQDFIGMTHKRVVAINNNVVKLVVNEDDFYSYESMKADAATYSATKIYGVKYVEAGLQASAITYYPVSLDILKTRILDPNIDTSDYKNVLSTREQLEEQLISSDKVDINDTVTQSKEVLQEQFKEASNEYKRLQEEKAEAEAYAAEAEE